jgi:hypothetical protein
VKGNFPSKHSANQSFVGIPKDCNPMNQTTIVEKNPMDPNPTKIIHNSFESNKPSVLMLAGERQEA